MPPTATNIRWIATRTDRVDHAIDAEPLGPWTLARPLGHSALGPRFLALHDDTTNPALAYRVDRRLIAHRERSAKLDLGAALDPNHRHLLAPTHTHMDTAGDLWLLAPYIGSARGILTLEQLASARDGGVIARHEAAFVGIQLLSASAHAHALGYIHGPLDAGQILVHPRGSLLVELYGVARRLRDLPVASDADRAEETRSIIALVRRLAFGSASGAHHGALGDWIARGLLPQGFPSAHAALTALEDALPSIGGHPIAARSWVREIVGILAWTLNRR